MRATLMPTAVAASAEPPAASTCVPKRVWKSTTCSATASTAATTNGQPKTPTPSVESRSRKRSMIVTGLPSERTSAAPDAADSVPRVTMKSVILAIPMSRPLTTPTTAPAATATSAHSQTDQP